MTRWRRIRDGGSRSADGDVIFRWESGSLCACVMYRSSNGVYRVDVKTNRSAIFNNGGKIRAPRLHAR